MCTQNLTSVLEFVVQLPNTCTIETFATVVITVTIVIITICKHYFSVLITVSYIGWNSFGLYHLPLEPDFFSVELVTLTSYVVNAFSIY